MCGLCTTEKEPHFYVWKFIRPACSPFNSNSQFHFYQAESIRSLFWKRFFILGDDGGLSPPRLPYPFPHFSPFISPHRRLILVQSHLLQPDNLVPAFRLRPSFVSIKPGGRENVILLCLKNLVVLISSNIMHTWGDDWDSHKHFVWLWRYSGILPQNVYNYSLQLESLFVACFLIINL